jgi:hypothetical protein
MLGLAKSFHRSTSLACVNATLSCDAENVGDVHAYERALYLFMLASFYWTNSVIKNVVQTTVASVVGTWWYYPQDISPFCTPVVGRPLLRSLTKSLGSICLGSLLIPLAQCLSSMERLLSWDIGKSECFLHARKENQDADTMGSRQLRFMEGDSAADSVRLCSYPYHLLECMASSLRSWNRWSFSYVGMYGYSFREGGERALELFETREWLEAASDNLIQDLLYLASVIIGGSTGTFAAVVDESYGYYFPSFHNVPTLWAFLIGSVLGYTLSSILLCGVVGSAVNTVQVLFAADPVEFEKSHPRLSAEMREAWSLHVWSPDG